MVNRRGLLGGAAAAAAALLSGCGVGRQTLVESTEEAAARVDGVTGVELELADGATFERLLHGTVSLDAEDRRSGLVLFDDVMRGIVTVIHAELDDPEARSLRVGGITAMLAEGDELTPLDLDPGVPGENPRRDRVTAESFYGKYGLI